MVDTEAAKNGTGDSKSPVHPSHVAQNQNAVFSFLAKPATHGLDHGVTRIDTHGAVVFLAGVDVYKVKRAVLFAAARANQFAMRTGTVKRSAPPVLPKTLYPLDGIRLACGSTNSICRGADTNLYMTRGSVGWELNPPTCAGLSVNDYLDVASS